MNELSDFTILEGKLTKYNGHGGDVVVPDGVTEIGSLVFSHNNSITGVTLPDTVEKIGWCAFSHCDNLSFVHIPKKSIDIHPQAFWWSEKLADKDGFVVFNGILFQYYKNEKVITIPPEVVRINEKVFEKKEVAVVTFPPGLKEIGKYAFINCKELTDLALPESVDVIGAGAFQGCEKLSFVSLPKEMKEIGANAFCSCSFLSDIRIPEKIESIEEFAFCYCARLSKVSFSATVKEIKSHAFMHSALLNISLPPELAHIGDNAFERCKQITEIRLPDSVSTIGKEAFKECSQLSKIHFSDSLISIGEDAFKGCNQLTSVHLPANLYRIGAGAFPDCSKLTHAGTDDNGILSDGQTVFKYYGDSHVISVPDGIKTIGECAFGGNAFLTEIILPESVETIENAAFAGCKMLRKITLPNTLSVISVNAFSGCSSLEAVDIPNGVKDLPSRVFAWCSSLRKVVFPSSLETISSEAFVECKHLEAAELPDGVKSIGASAFRNCQSLKLIRIPRSVESFGRYFIQGCYCKIYLQSWTPQFSASLSGFYFIPEDCRVEDFASLPSRYKMPIALTFIKEGNQDLSTPRAKSHLKYIAANAGKMASVAIEEPEVLHFLCEHRLIKAKDIDLFLNEAQEWGDEELEALLHDYQNKLGNTAVERARERKTKSAENSEKVVSERSEKRKGKIGLSGLKFAFSGRLDTSYRAVWRSREEIEEYLHHYGAQIAKSVTAEVDYVVLLDKLSTGAAEKAKGLGIKVLNEDEFNRLVGRRFDDLEHITVPSWMDYIPADSFRGTSYLSKPVVKTVSLPDTITRIDHGAFFQCENLTEINIPERVVSIGSFAFCGCRSLKKITIPKGIKRIGQQAFDGCRELSEIDLPEGTIIEPRAFSGCDLLADQDGYVIINHILLGVISSHEQLVIPEGVIRIGDRVLSGGRGQLSKKPEIVFPSSLISIGAGALSDSKVVTVLVLPDSLKRIEQGAFCHCCELKRAWIPSCTTEIGEGAFSRCSKLRIYAPAGSYAEQYAKENSIRFTPCEREDFLQKNRLDK